MDRSNANTQARIFISYRREETAYPAGWLFDRLNDHFGDGQIFKDVDSIELGDDFVDAITSAVGSCDVVLALIGDRWLSITDEDGRRRLDKPDDFVRLEIEAALVRNIRVIPILVGGATMPRPDELPPALTKLARRHALELSPIRFESDARRLLTVLDKTLAEVRAISHGQESEVAELTPRTAQDPTVRRQVPERGVPPPVSELGTSPQRRSFLPRQSRRNLVGGLAFVVVLLTLAFVLTGNGGEPGPVEVVVDGTAPWTDTGIDVATGDAVQITAWGEVFHNEGSSIGPEGFPNRPDLLTPLDRANHAGLLGRVGATGPPFYVGAGTTFTVGQEGRLFLGINDGGLENNRGSFTAKVTVGSN